jgi:hypothetical protein
MSLIIDNITTEGNLSGNTLYATTANINRLVVTGGTGVNWISGNTSTDMLRVTQGGSGNSFVVEDSSNPDTTQFIIDSIGRVGIGTTSLETLGFEYDKLVSFGTSTGSTSPQPYEITSAIKGFQSTAQYGVGVYGYGQYVGVQGGQFNAPIYGGGFPSYGVRGEGGVAGGDFISSSIGVIGSAGMVDEFGTVVEGIGGKFAANVGYGSSPSYSVQLLDGTEGVDKVLVSQTLDGKSNWSSNLTGLTSVKASGTVSAATLTITSTPTNNNNNTEILTRNSTTGNIEYSTAPSQTFYPYGIGFAQSIGNYLT